MPEFKATVHVMLKRSILDPQGRAVESTLKRLGHQNVRGLRVGKTLELVMSGEREEVERQLADMVRKVFSNPVMEDATFSLTELAPESGG